jgi:hypothetical protein
VPKSRENTLFLYCLLAPIRSSTINTKVFSYKLSTQQNQKSKINKVKETIMNLKNYFKANQLKARPHGSPADSQSKISAHCSLLSVLFSLFIVACDQPTDTPPPPVYNPPLTWELVDSEPFVRVQGETTPASIRKLSFGNGRFVAVGENSTAWYSDDGLEWTASSDKAVLLDTDNQNITGLCFGGGIFVATAGSNGNVVRAWSTDGDVWRTSKNSANGYNGHAVAYGNGTFTVGGSAGRLGYNDDPRNPDGWIIINDKAQTTFTLDSSKCYINAIAYGNGIFVAGGGNGHSAWSTDNGRTWNSNTQTDDIFNYTFINGVAFGNNTFVVAGERNTLAWSTDGRNWTMVVDPGIQNGFLNIGYANGYFLALGGAGDASYSSDGIHWTAIPDPAMGGTAIRAVTYGEGKFLIAGANKMAYSIVE